MENQPANPNNPQSSPPLVNDVHTPPVQVTPMQQPAPMPQAVNPAAPPGPSVIAPASSSHKGKHPVVITIAVILALLLAAATVFVYLRSQNEEQRENAQDSSTNAAEPAANADPATTSETLDEADQAVTDALAGSETTDTPEADLEDAALGL